MKYLRALEAALSKILSWWCMLLMGVLAIGMILSVFLRYLFGLTFVWAEAFITMIFIGTTYFGAALGVRENEHISIEYFSAQFPPSMQKIIQAMVMLVIIAVEGVIFKTSLTWIARVGSIPEVALALPKSYFYIMVPISAALMIFYVMVKIILTFGSRHK